MNILQSSEWEAADVRLWLLPVAMSRQHYEHFMQCQGGTKNLFHGLYGKLLMFNASSQTSSIIFSLQPQSKYIKMPNPTKIRTGDVHNKLSEITFKTSACISFCLIKKLPGFEPMISLRIVYLPITAFQVQDRKCIFMYLFQSTLPDKLSR